MYDLYHLQDQNSFLCQLSVVVLLNTINACPVIPFFLIPTFATCDGDEGKTHEVSPDFTFIPLSQSVELYRL